MTMKLKRMLLCLGLVLSMSFLLFGCGPNNQDANATGAPEDTIDESIDESTDVAEGTEVMEEPSETTPEVSNDPMDALLVTEDIARTYGGYYLFKNGNLYSLNRFISIEKARQYNIGWRWNETIGAVSYRARASNTGDMISMGDVPIATVEKGDEIRGYKSANIGLDKATFAGYSLIIFNSGNGALLYNDLEAEPTEIHDLSSMQIEDEDGNIIPTENMHDLDYRKTYKVTCTKTRRNIEKPT